MEIFFSLLSYQGTITAASCHIDKRFTKRSDFVLQLPAADLLIPVHFEYITSGEVAVDTDGIRDRVLKQISRANQALKGNLPGCRGNCQDTRIRLVTGNCIPGSQDCPAPEIQARCILFLFTAPSCPALWACTRPEFSFSHCWHAEFIKKVLMK